jgi:hypothetical protein
MNTAYETLRETKSTLKDLLNTKYRYSKLYFPRSTFDNFKNTKYNHHSNNHSITINNNNNSNNNNNNNNNNINNNNKIINNISINPINYDEFIYTDKLTKKKIIMREALTSY